MDRTMTPQQSIIHAIQNIAGVFHNRVTIPVEQRIHYDMFVIVESNIIPITRTVYNCMCHPNAVLR